MRYFSNSWNFAGLLRCVERGCVERALLPACLQHHKTSGQECPLHPSFAGQSLPPSQPPEFLPSLGRRVAFTL